MGAGAEQRRLLGFYRWAEARNRRPARYPAPLNQYCNQLDFWKFFPTLTALASGVVVASLHQSNPIREFKDTLLLLLSFAMLFFNVAYVLQDIIPEIAVVALLAGVSAVVTWFHILVCTVLPLAPEMMTSIICVGYIPLILLVVCKIVKEDVREPIDRASSNWLIVSP